MPTEPLGLPPSPREPDKRPLPLFAYGRLRDATFVGQLLERTPVTAPGRLDGFDLVSFPGLEAPVLVEMDEGSVEGTLYLDLTVDDFHRLDAYAGVSEDLYWRHVVEVTTAGAGAPTPAFLYLVTEKTMQRRSGR